MYEDKPWSKTSAARRQYNRTYQNRNKEDTAFFARLLDNMTPQETVAIIAEGKLRVPPTKTAQRLYKEALDAVEAARHD